MRIIWAVVAGLALMASLMASPLAPGDDRSGVCVGGMQIVACVPPEGA